MSDFRAVNWALGFCHFSFMIAVALPFEIIMCAYNTPNNLSSNVEVLNPLCTMSPRSDHSCGHLQPAVRGPQLFAEPVHRGLQFSDRSVRT